MLLHYVAKSRSPFIPTAEPGDDVFLDDQTGTVAVLHTCRRLPGFGAALHQGHLVAAVPEAPGLPVEVFQIIEERVLALNRLLLADAEATVEQAREALTRLRAG